MIVLIADDDRLIRFTMKSMLTEILKTDYVFYEASNGLELVQLCEKYQPDIAFADIKMPYMDGITAIEKCKKISKNTEFVVISGYSEFEYAKRCISIGINEYLLKPVEEEQLASIVEKLRRKIIENGRESNSKFQLKLFEAFNYFSTVGMSDEYEEFPCKEGMSYMVIGLFMGNSKIHQSTDRQFQEESGKYIQKYGNELIDKGEYYTNLYSEEGIQYFCFCIHEQEREKILFHIRKWALQNSQRGPAFTFVYFYADSVKEIYRRCERADRNISGCIQYLPGAVLREEKLMFKGQDKETLDYIYSLLSAWNRMDAVEYKNMADKISVCPLGSLDLEPIRQYCFRIMGELIKAETFPKFGKELKKLGESIYKNVKTNEDNVADKVKKYVEKYYMDDISISQIAEQLNFTPNYLSTIFHQQTGEKFVNYVMEVRMMNAKRLLIENPTASVKDIAVMVGYNSPRYFSELFQKKTGTTPSAYRKNNI